MNAPSTKSERLKELAKARGLRLAGKGNSEEYRTLMQNIEIQQAEAVEFSIRRDLEPEMEPLPPSPYTAREIVYEGVDGARHHTAFLRRDQNVRDFVERQGHNRDGGDGVRLPSLMRAMVTGPRNDAERAALSLGVDTAGSYTGAVHMSAETIDLMRARTVAIRAGARTVPIEGETTFARLVTDPVAAWHGENAAINASDPTFGQLVVIPKTLVALVTSSRELIEDAPNAESMLEVALTGALAVELDRAAFFGNGIGAAPLGLANVSGVGSVSMGTNGAALTDYDKLLDARQLLLDANADEPTAYVMAPRTSTAIAKLRTGLTSDKTQLRRPAELVEASFLTTTSAPVNETQGSANNASRIITGQFANLWIAVRTQLRIELLKEKVGSVNYQVGFLAHLRATIAVARPNNFAMVIGIIP